MSVYFTVSMWYKNWSPHADKIHYSVLHFKHMFVSLSFDILS